MPQPDPLLSSNQSLKRRFLRIFSLLAVLSIVIALIAVLVVTQGAGEVHASLIIATFVGVGLSMLLGSALMALMFLSSSSGHDDAANPHHHESDDQ